MKDEDSSRKGIQVISRAAAVLRSLKEYPDGLSLGQIAQEIALPRSTVQRIVGALQSERLVIANATGGGVRLGPELGALAQAARFDTAEQCHQHLLTLTQKTGETSDLSVFRDDKMIFLDQVQGTHRLRTISSIGEVFPLATTANGRACLAKLPRDQALDLTHAEMKQAGRSFDAASFAKMLDNIAATGLAYDLDEHAEGISAVGYAFRDMLGVLHAISVPVPTSRFQRKRPEITEALRAVALELQNSDWVDHARGATPS